MNDTERLIQQVKTTLHKSDRPLTTREIDEQIDSQGIEMTKFVLRRMIDRGEVKTHPRFRYSLPSHVRRSMDKTT